ncbi:MAG: asparagine synthase (glutamine-hydrolyzing) [Arenimonas sp.]
MCGITGIFSYSASANNIDRDELRRIRDYMAMRGPDGFGEWFSDDDRVGFGHRRLSIIDLSERGAQPMQSTDGRFVITFNGEIYNYRHLREKLEVTGHVFRSDSDTEVLLHLFSEKGAAMLPDLRGMFAFAIWDNRDKTLFLARDAFGIKPLYFVDDGKTFRFASQVKALLQGSVDTTPEPAGHAGFLLWGTVPEPYTLYKGIRSLPPGHCMLVDGAGKKTPVSFCDISDVLAHASQMLARGDRQTALREIVAAIEDSVSAHQIADVPVGVFLSSGMDSSMIAATAVLKGSSSYTLTLGFREYVGTMNDEVPLAEEVARNLGAWHHTMMTSRQDFEDERERLLHAMDQPSIDGVNTWFVARAAAQMDMKVAMSGLGGDELFASYPSFKQLPKIVRYGKVFKNLPTIGRTLRALSSPVFSKITSPKYAGLLEYSHNLGSAYLLRRCLYSPWEISRHMDPDFIREGLQELDTAKQLNDSVEKIKSDRLAVSALEMKWYMRNQLLRDADWAGMAQSLEIRVPFVDVDLIRKTAPWFAAYPDITKAEIAALAAPNLPTRVLKRPKTGFLIPVREWIKPDTDASEPRGLRGWAKFIHGRFGATAVPNMRVLVLTTDAYGGHGGIALYNRDVIDSLALISNVGEIVVIPRTMPLSPEKIPDKVKFLKEVVGSKFRFVKAALAASSGKFDLVVCGHINILPLAVLLNLKLRAPLALMVYGIDVWESPYRLAKFFAKKASAIWSISEITTERMMAWTGIRKDKFVQLPNAIHLDRYGLAEKRQDLLQRYGLQGKKILMTLARLPSAERYKGVDEVLAVMPELLKKEPSLHYLVVGDGNDRQRLAEKAVALGLKDKVVFTGFIDEAEKADHFRLADVFVMPGRGEGFGFVFLEALACGIPAVGSQIDGSREALLQGELGELVDPLSLQSIESGILAALEKKKEIPANLAYFSWPKFRERIEQALNSAMGKGTESA